eukprot:906146-Prymnesium_polylepis.2
MATPRSSASICDPGTLSARQLSKTLSTMSTTPFWTSSAPARGARQSRITVPVTTSRESMSSTKIAPAFSVA